MTAIKVNSFLWNALSDEDKKSIESYFNHDNSDDFSISPDPEFPLPKSESIIYSLTEKDLHELTEDEIKCRLKYIEMAAIDIYNFVSTYNDAALLACLGIIIEKYKKDIDKDAISCIEITERESKYYDELLREISEKKEQTRDDSKEIFKVNIGDIATMKLFKVNTEEIESPYWEAKPSVRYKYISGWSFWCRIRFKCKNTDNSYPCGKCR